MFTIKSFEDVVEIARVFGKDALQHIVANHTMSQEAEKIIYSCTLWAANQGLEIESFNDGNTEYSIHAAWDSERVNGELVTGLDNITIVRWGFGAFTMSAKEAMRKGEIDSAQLQKVLDTIQRRNYAAQYVL